MTDKEIDEAMSGNICRCGMFQPHSGRDKVAATEKMLTRMIYFFFKFIRKITQLGADF